MENALHQPRHKGLAVIGLYLACGGALGLAAFPSLQLFRIFSGIGTFQEMMSQLQRFSLVVLIVTALSAGLYATGVGLIRRRPWSRGAALLMLLLSILISAAVAIAGASNYGALWLGLITYSCCFVWIVRPSTKAAFILGSDEGGAAKRSSISLAGFVLGCGFGVLYLGVLLWMLRHGSQVPAIAWEAGVVLLPLLTAVAVCLASFRSTQSAGSFSCALGVTMLAAAFAASALLPNQLLGGHPAFQNALVLGSSTPDLTAIQMLIRALLHTYLLGGLWLMAGIALSVRAPWAGRRVQRGSMLVAAAMASAASIGAVVASPLVLTQDPSVVLMSFAAHALVAGIVSAMALHGSMDGQS